MCKYNNVPMAKKIALDTQKSLNLGRFQALDAAYIIIPTFTVYSTILITGSHKSHIDNFLA